ncbi:hypothetical protein AB9P05_02810 [Roseivirga sp. BDSF3-8]|uniref:hypothetical protein n=1 Tax=Roseivirga sp. BDSF3-8 TaxID=3241598 RepID=UPI003532134D
MATFFSRVTEELTWQEGEEGLAKLYLLKEGDERNRILFTNQRLIVFRHGKLSTYSRANLSHISMEHKKLLAPLIGGGIAGGLTLFAIFKGIAASSLAIIILILCSYLFYLGIKGSPALLVHHGFGRQISTDLILIPNKSEGTNGFIGYVNRQLIMREEQPLYLSITNKQWELLLSQGGLVPSDDYFTLSKEPEKESSQIQLRLIPEKLEKEVRYEKNKDGTMEYRLYSTLERQMVRLHPEPGQQPVI